MNDNPNIRFIALDQDPVSLEEVQKTWNGRVELVCSSVIDILRKDPIDGKDFDFIYSAGLYDYLNDNLSERLTASLFGKLKAGGTLLIANFLPDPPHLAFMEAFMDWWLIYRNEDQMLRMTARIDPTEISGHRLYTEETGRIIFLEITKRQ
jgi:extracellular factor (EF) 3-hydroxypalmitic acid methyl ester biosynthesis protein